jgi:hypothetical protein
MSQPDARAVVPRTHPPERAQSRPGRGFAQAKLGAAAGLGTALLLAGCVVPPDRQVVETTPPVLVRAVTRATSFELSPRAEAADIVVRLERVEKKETREAREHVVRTAVWRYDPVADAYEWLNPFIALVLMPFDAFGVFECGVDGTRHPFSLWETAVVSTVPFLNVRRSAGGWSPFIGSTPTIESETVREGELRQTEVDRFPLVDRSVEILISGSAVCSARTGIDGEARFAVARLRDLPWEQGAAELVARSGVPASAGAARASLPPGLEQGLRRARAEDLNGRALVAESRGQLEAARDAARGARALGHAGAPALERRLDGAIALDRSRGAIVAGDLAGAARLLAGAPADDAAAGELGRRLAASIARRAILRARVHLLAGRPARATALALELGPGEGHELALAARSAWASRVRGPGAGLLLSGAALVLGGTRDEQGAFALELARAVAPGEPDPERFAAASSEAERFERACRGEIASPDFARTLRREAAASARALARRVGVLEPGAELERALDQTSAARLELEPALPDCGACRGSGVDLTRGDELEPCRRCGGSGLAR